MLLKEVATIEQEDGFTGEGDRPVLPFPEEEIAIGGKDVIIIEQSGVIIGSLIQGSSGSE